jgi:hypothetical protein
MTCAQYEELLYLHRPGERSPEEDLALSGHLRTCAACAELNRRIQRAGLAIENLRTFTPVPPDLQDALDAVSARLAGTPGSERRSFLSNGFDRLLSMFDFPSARYASAFVVVVIVAAYLFQQVRILNDVATLQDRLAAGFEGGPRLQVAYAVKPASDALVAATGKALRSLDMSDRFDPARGVVLSRADAENLRLLVMRQAFSALEDRRVLGLDRRTIDRIVKSATENLTVMLRIEEKGATR